MVIWSLSGFYFAIKGRRHAFHIYSYELWADSLVISFDIWIAGFVPGKLFKEGSLLQMAFVFF